MLERKDGVDFNLAAFSWLLNKHWNKPVLNEQFKNFVIDAILQLPFWLNETGDLKDMQYWSENHQIGWKAGKYLIGQAFANNPELQGLIFQASNSTGAEAKLLGKAHVQEWLDYRSRFGFSEFNSDTYAPIAFKAIASIVGLSEDPEVRNLASMVANLQIFDHILGTKGKRCVYVNNVFFKIQFYVSGLQLLGEELTAKARLELRNTISCISSKV